MSSFGGIETFKENKKAIVLEINAFIKDTGCEINYRPTTRSHVMSDVKFGNIFYVFGDHPGELEEGKESVRRIIEDYLTSSARTIAKERAIEKLGDMIENVYGYKLQVQNHEVFLENDFRKLRFSFDIDKFGRLSELRFALIRLLR